MKLPLSLILLKSTLGFAVLTIASSVWAAPGDFDPTFGADAKGPDSNVFGLSITPGDKIGISGFFTSVTDAAGTANRLRFARLNTDGSVDTDFGDNGKGADSSVYCYAIQPDGTAIIAGAFTQITDAAGTHLRNGVARLRPDGSVDTGFGSDGNGVSFITAMAIQPDGKILIGGNFIAVTDNTGSHPRNRFARLNTDGSLDTGFGADNHGVSGSATAIALQPDGKIIVGGTFTQAGDGTSVIIRDNIVRFNADGSLDTAFGADGEGLDGAPNSLIVQPDGKIFAAGFFSSISDSTASYARLKVARFEADGSVDTSFGSAGNGPDHSVYSAALQTDGKIVIGGTFAKVGDPLALHNRSDFARLNDDGTVDTAFGSDDTATSGGVLSIALQSDGKILVAGNFSAVTDSAGISLSRLRIARLENDSATSSLTSLPTKIEWLRGGTSPEAARVTFESSTDGGTTWSPLGDGTRKSGGWELTGLDLEAGTQIRARAFVPTGTSNGSQSILEETATTAEPDPWTVFYEQANFYYQYFTGQGDADSGLAYWFYFRAYGDQAYYKALGYSPYAQFKFYEGLAYFYYTFYKNSAPNLGAYFLYLNFAYAYLDYLTLSGDPAAANSLYNFYYALALSVL